MKLKSTIWILVIFSTILLMSTNSIVPVYTDEWNPPTNPPYPETFEKYGPRVSELKYVIEGDLTKESEDFYAGKIDLMDWPASPGKIAPWLADEDIWMGPVVGLWYYELDLNLQNWPIGDGLGEAMYDTVVSKWPTPRGEGYETIDYTRLRAQDCREFRRALAYLVPRDAVLDAMMGYGVILDTFIPPVIGGWEKFANGTSFFDYDPPVPTYTTDEYLANLTLWEAGFRDYDLDGDLEYSPTRSAGDTDDLWPLQVWIRSDDPIRTVLGVDFCKGLEKYDIPYDQYTKSRTECYDHAWVKYDSHVYTGGWDIGREPDYYYDTLHSSMDTFPRAGANGYMRVHDPELDPWAEALKFAKTTDDARVALYMCEYMAHSNVYGIPSHTDIGYQAARKEYGSFSGEEKYAGEEWLGLINAVGEGFWHDIPPNTWTNAHPGIFEKGGVIRQGMLNDIESFNAIHAEWFWDGLVLDAIYDFLIVGDPLDVSTYIPWMCTDFYTGSWYNATSGTWGSYAHFDLIDNILWHGTTNRFTAQDVKTSFELMKKCRSVLWYPYVEKLDHIDIIDDFTVEIFYSVESCWIEGWVSSIYMIPDYIWGLGGVYNADPDLIWVATPETDGTLIGTGAFVYDTRVLNEYVRLVENPYYFRKLVWPDVCDPSYTVGVRDQIVGLDDFMWICYSGGMMVDENPDGTWPSTPGAWGPYLDVNYDATINIGDLMEISAYYKPGIPSWPPPYY